VAKESAGKDPNYVNAIMGVDMNSPLDTIKVFVDSSTHRMLVQATATISTGQGKTLLFAAINAAPGTTTIVAAQGVGLKIKVVSYVFTMSLAGTVKFLDDTADMSGAMNFAAQGGAVVLGQPSDHIMETTANNNLKITTTTGTATGHMSYIVEA
jgi:hypothetical protein